MPSLEERVQGLAAELSIRIKEFTFTLEEDEIEITEGNVHMLLSAAQS